MTDKKLTTELLDKVRHIEGFPVGADEDIIPLLRQNNSRRSGRPAGRTVKSQRPGRKYSRPGADIKPG